METLVSFLMGVMLGCVIILLIDTPCQGCGQKICAAGSKKGDTAAQQAPDGIGGIPAVIVHSGAAVAIILLLLVLAVIYYHRKKRASSLTYQKMLQAAEDHHMHCRAAIPNSKRSDSFVDSWKARPLKPSHLFRILRLNVFQINVAGVGFPLYCNTMWRFLQISVLFWLGNGNSATLFGDVVLTACEPFDHAAGANKLARGLAGERAWALWKLFLVVTAFHWWHAKNQRIFTRDFNRKNREMSDYALLVSGLPPWATSEKALKEYFQEVCNAIIHSDGEDEEEEEVEVEVEDEEEVDGQQDQSDQANWQWTCRECGFRNAMRNVICGGNGPLGCKAAKPDEEQAPSQALQWLGCEAPQTPATKWTPVPPPPPAPMHVVSGPAQPKAPPPEHLLLPRVILPKHPPALKPKPPQVVPPKLSPKPPQAPPPERLLAVAPRSTKQRKEPPWRRLFKQSIDTELSGDLQERIVDVDCLRFAQETMKWEFSDGKSLEQLVQDLKAGAVHPLKDSFLTLEVTEDKGILYSSNNRRLWCLKKYQEENADRVQVRIKVLSQKGWEQAKRHMRNFDTKCRGKRIKVRRPRRSSRKRRRKNDN
eukprot:TRINITY_DN23381_c1_g2_i2.p1 TRINITY_DN23381_c1_g2~~TRINITY_DN23381_c1_g2_i2.p1  ORF type:complete len:592 (+),score=111.48 TRINITY_DN23381_c1_g2_i2:54-1829(+)